MNGDDIWGGYSVQATPPGVERDVIYLFSPKPAYAPVAR